MEDSSAELEAAAVPQQSDGGDLRNPFVDEDEPLLLDHFEDPALDIPPSSTESAALEGSLSSAQYDLETGSFLRTPVGDKDSAGSARQSPTSRTVDTYTSSFSQQSNSSRRRPSARRRPFPAAAVTSSTSDLSVISSTTASTTSNSMQRGSHARPPLGRRWNPSSNSPALGGSSQHNSSSSADTPETHSSLRRSLDAGMATLQRWLRARPAPQPTPPPQQPRARTGTWQHEEWTSLRTQEINPWWETSQGEIAENDSDSALLTTPPRARSQRQPQSLPETSRQRAFSESDTLRRFRTSLRRHPISSSAAAALTTPQQQQQQPPPSSANTFDLEAPQASISSPPGATTPAAGIATEALNDLPTIDIIPPSTSRDEDEREQRARIRWIRINRRFQLVITVVALIFSLLLFTILIAWVALTSTYVVSFDKSCDVPLKPYFWLVTLQLVLDVFRTDIMRFVFRWDSNSNVRVPARVIVYNMTYLLYALLVLRLGILSVFVDESTCRDTAPELFKASTAFVSLSIVAWATIVCGYLLPFCVVAALLTINGYQPSSMSSASSVDTTPAPVFPAAYSQTGAPAGTVDRLDVLDLNTLQEGGMYPRECCICMEDFEDTDDIVKTVCHHVFHKQCCREWLRQSRTCPVCRNDIPSSLEIPPSDDESESPNRIPLGPTGRPVRGLLRILQRRSTRNAGSSVSVSAHDDDP